MDLALVYNPEARLAGLATPDVLKDSLERNGARVVQTIVCGSEGYVADRVASIAGSLELILVAGGDGTVNAVAQALAGTETAMAVVPLGTGNVLAEELGLRPGAWRQAIDVALHGRRCLIDVGRANGRIFVTMFGAGLDARVVESVEQRSKSAAGRWAFVAELVRQVVRFRPHRMVLSVDGCQWQGAAMAAIVCNTARYAWRLHLQPLANPSDGLLDVVVLPPAGPARLLASGVGTFLLARPFAAWWWSARGRAVWISANPPAPWQVDGELGGSTPVRLEVQPRCLWVVAREGSSVEAAQRSS